MRGSVAFVLVASVASGCETRTDGVGIANQHPVHLVRPVDAPLSAVARIGREIFYDTTLSESGHMSCATCHQPRKAHAGGTSAGRGVVRAVPSLRYVYRTPNFSIGPSLSDVDDTIAKTPAAPPGAPRVKVAGTATHSDALVPRGGLFWDGRVNTLQDQAMGPLFNPAEMANRDVASVSARLRRAPYASRFAPLFGPSVLDTPARLVDEAMFAVARYQIEDLFFHSYDSKYDAYLEGKEQLTESEARGLAAFEDKARGNCAACHLDTPGADGLPPAFTDYEYEALGVPRVSGSRAADLGACGPLRADLRDESRYCGMFRTPSLRNVAVRPKLFHNGVYSTLEQVLEFYNSRDVRAASIYPVGANGDVQKFNDLPIKYHANVDTIDAPFNRKRGDPPAMSAQDMRDIISFLKTLTDRDRSPTPATP